jgi:hypothetical protein
MKAYGGVEVKLPLTLNLGTGRRCGQIHVQAALLPGKKAPIPTELRDVWSFARNRTKAVIIAITKLQILSIVIL